MLVLPPLSICSLVSSLGAACGCCWAFAWKATAAAATTIIARIEVRIRLLQCIASAPNARTTERFLGAIALFADDARRRAFRTGPPRKRHRKGLRVGGSLDDARYLSAHLASYLDSCVAHSHSCGALATAKAGS